MEEKQEDLLVYEEIEAKIKRNNLIIVVTLLITIAYVFLLLFYLMIIHNPSFSLSQIAIPAIGVLSMNELKKKNKNHKDDLDYILRYNEEHNNKPQLGEN